VRQFRFASIRVQAIADQYSSALMEPGATAGMNRPQMVNNARSFGQFPKLAENEAFALNSNR
jgi:hypothetical protein